MTEKFIKISDLKKKLNYIFRVYGVSPQMRKTINEAINKIPYTIKGDLETTLEVADVQEVVRCKDCKHNGYCTVQDYVMFKDDNYCSRGIRTDGEENENV